MSGSSVSGASDSNNIAELITEYAALVQREEGIPPKIGDVQLVALAKMTNDNGHLTVRVNIHLQDHPLLIKDYINGTAQLMAK